MRMIERRFDMSEWAIHFVHSRNPEYAPSSTLFSSLGGRIPFHSDKERDDSFRHWHDRDDQHDLTDDASGLAVLSKIIDDGHIRAGWSFRGGSPTIYGPRPACCFTEMPLSSFLIYAETRARKERVDTYAICVLKRELFAAGGRPVIYGTSVSHQEKGDSKWPRLLDENCGIGEREQFRYVSFNPTRPQGPNDWTHEREWRWSDVNDKCSTPGLPIWIADPSIKFSRIILVVKKKDEAEGVLNQLKQRHDAGRNPFDDEYRIEALRNTSIVAIDQLPDGTNVRIEDIPEHYIPFQRPSPSPEFIAKVKQALAIARQAGLDAAEHNRPPVANFGHLLASYGGRAFGMVFDPQSELTEALIALKVVTVKCWGGYQIKLFEDDDFILPILSVSEAAVEAALSVLEQHFPDSVFWWRTEPTESGFFSPVQSEPE